ncbi:class I SAM-dependent methyltransferase [Acetobacter fallax]|uniref:Methyltransferase domain-containing protein n=1 Tax=Acetobacter fallax TaxID=1737473 RepID=A0ABX0KAW6_9PROT|nr:class I SAM-dependent methyltransferase [Acetobacter fallax]NHO33550.1 methyltransferase domain-containing protein [Acetobacter fallax]NHO36519.1 methyltransferase domain-containing protein [Acetobacter fallax]
MLRDALQKKSYSKEARAFDESFLSSPCRRAYDILGWRAVSSLTLPERTRIIDAGCGTGRWCERFLAAGHDVKGIENAPGMLACLEAKDLGSRFTTVPGNMEDVFVPAGSADLVIAIGSLQYCVNQERMISRFFDWLTPEGQIAVMVDSLLALVSEFLQTQQEEKAEQVLETREGSFTSGGVTTRLHLYDRRSLMDAFSQAGFVDIACRGLVASGAVLGRTGCEEAMKRDEEAFLERDATIAAHEVMSDCGLHLLLTARRP